MGIEGFQLVRAGWWTPDPSWWDIHAKTDAWPPWGCWLWRGAPSGTMGYGQCYDERGRRTYAHRISWRMAYGNIPIGLCVLHACDVPLCVNPNHLFLGTLADNCRDRDRKGRTGKGFGGFTHPLKTHCKHGHDLSDAYLIDKHRVCRACSKMRNAKYYQQHKEGGAR